MLRRNSLDGIALAALALGLAGCLGTASEGEDGGSSAGGSSGSSATAGATGAGGSSGANGTGAASSGGQANGSSGGAASSGSSAGGATGGITGGSGGVAGSGSTGTIVGGTSGTIMGGGSSGGSTGSVISTSAGGSGGSTGSVISTSAGGSSGGAGGSSTGGNAGSFCSVPESGQPDPCASTGLACIGVSPVSATGTCQLPANGYPCEPATGCSAGNSCVGNTGQTYCYQQCNATSDCSETYETCQQEGVGPTGSLCVAETCTQFYAPCNVVGTGDGYCVPFADPPNPPYGLCVAGAPADAGVPSSCTTFGRGGGLCPVGMFCYTDYETTGTQCEPFCGVEPVNGSVGPGCGAGQFCAQNFSNLFGACAESCPVPNQSADCPTQQNCLVTGQVYADGGPAFTCEP